MIASIAELTATSIDQPLATLARVAAAVVNAVAAARRRRRAIRALSECDDRMLADIGLRRSDIEHVVQVGRAGLATHAPWG